MSIILSFISLLRLSQLLYLSTSFHFFFFLPYSYLHHPLAPYPLVLPLSPTFFSLQFSLYISSLSIFSFIFHPLLSYSNYLYVSSLSSIFSLIFHHLLSSHLNYLSLSSLSLLHFLLLFILYFLLIQILFLYIFFFPSAFSSIFHLISSHLNSLSMPSLSLLHFLSFLSPFLASRGLEYCETTP